MCSGVCLKRPIVEPPLIVPATCPGCLRFMEVGEGCEISWIVFADKSETARLPVTRAQATAPRDIRFPGTYPHPAPKEPICSACAAPVGSFHHLGCKSELCPRCRTVPLMRCSCKLYDLPLSNTFHAFPDGEEPDDDVGLPDGVTLIVFH